MGVSGREALGQAVGERYAQSLAGGYVLLFPGGTRRLLGLALLGLDAARAKNGYEPGPDVAELIGALRMAVEQASLPTPPPIVRRRTGPDVIDTREAAELLGCQPRNVRDLAARGVFATAEQGHQRRWAINRAEVLARAVSARAEAQKAVAGPY
jgi:hypothetical protein